MPRTSPHCTPPPGGWRPTPAHCWGCSCPPGTCRHPRLVWGEGGLPLPCHGACTLTRIIPVQRRVSHTHNEKYHYNEIYLKKKIYITKILYIIYIKYITKNVIPAGGISLTFKIMRTTLGQDELIYQQLNGL